MLLAYPLAIFMLLLSPLLAFYFLWIIIGLGGFLAVFSVSYGDSWLVRLDPRVKLLLALVVPAVSQGFSPVYQLLLLSALLALYAFTPDPRQKYAFMIPLLLSVEVPSAWLAAITFGFAFRGGLRFVFPPALTALGVRGISLNGFVLGLESSLRTSTALAASFLLVLTSSPSDLLRSLTKSKLPVELAFALSVALTAIPKLVDSITSTLETARSRGMGVDRVLAGPSELYYFLVGVFLAVANVVILTVKDAQQFAISADLRGFRSVKGRSYYKELKFSAFDWLATVFLLCAWGVSIYLFGRGNVSVFKPLEGGGHDRNF